MDTNSIRREIANNLIKQGLLEKESKFLKELRSRWIVLTSNYLMCFRNQDCSELTESIDLKYVVTIKSHFSRTDLGTGFKVSSDDISLCFRCTSTAEKWCWLVALERVVELKQRGATVYNNQQLLRTRGFPSIDEYEGTETRTIEFVNLLASKEAECTPRSSLRRAEIGKQPRFTQYLKASEQSPFQKRAKARSQEQIAQSVDRAVQTEAQPTILFSSPQSSIVAKKNSKPIVRPRYTDKRDITNSQFMAGLFDQLEIGSSVLKQLILGLLIKIGNIAQPDLHEFLLCECRVHPGSSTLAGLFVLTYAQEIESEPALAEAYSFLQLILKNISDFFSYEQLQQLKSLLARSVVAFKKEGSILLALSIVELVDCLDSYTSQESAAIVKTVGQLQRTSGNAAAYEEFLKNFHHG